MVGGEGEGGGEAIETHSGEEGWPRSRLQLRSQKVDLTWKYQLGLKSIWKQIWMPVNLKLV